MIECDILWKEVKSDAIEIISFSEYFMVIYRKSKRLNCFEYSKADNITSVRLKI